MFSFIKRWLSKPQSSSVAGPRYDVYRPEERTIYTYWNGEREVLADPMVLYKKLMEVWPVLSIDMKLAYSIHSDALEGHSRYVEGIRKVFGVKPWDEDTKTGLTEPQTTDLIDHFWLFCESVKKNSSPTQTSLTETSVPTRSSSGGSPVTSNTSESGSTEGASSTDGLTPLPSVRVSPSAT